MNQPFHVLVGLALVFTPTAFAQHIDKMTPMQAQRAAEAAQPHQKQSPPTIHHPAPQQKGPPNFRARGMSTPVVHPPQAPAPLIGGADSCITPDIVVGTGSFAFDNTLATTGVEGQNESLCNLTGAGTTIINDVWFTWTATQTGLAQVSTCNVSSIDTKIAIYNGTTCPVSGSAIACNDDACPGYQSTVSFSCVLGQSYVIQLGNYPGTAPPATPGSGVFTLNVSIPPANDNCSTPTAITGTGTFPYDNTVASAGSQGQTESLCNFFGSTGIDFDVWYTWTASFTGWAEVSTCTGSFDDTKIAVYPGAGCPVASALGCNDDFCGAQSLTRFPCTSGNQYTIQIGDSPGLLQGSVGSFTIAVGVPPPTNDDCSTPLAVAGLGPFNFDNTFASTGSQGQVESLCAIYGNTMINNDLWYAWTATFSGTAAAETCGSFIDTKIAVYPGAGCPVASALGCDDDTCGAESRTLFACTAGQQYTIQLGLDPFNTFGGAGSFDIISVMPPVNDDCTTPIALTGLGNTPYNLTFASTGAQGQSEAICFFAGQSAINDDIWYSWTATFSGTAGVRTCGQTDDTKIAVYSGSGCPVSSSIACNDDYCNAQSLVTFPCSVGSVYTFQVGLYASNGGAGQINVFDAAPPANDSCAAAVNVSGAGPFPFDTSFATTGSQGQAEALCSISGSPTVNNDEWFTWTAPASGAFSVQNIGLTTSDSKIAVYPGAGCPTSAALACNDDANEPNQIYAQSQAIFNATAGSTYTIQLGVGPFTTGGDAGEFSIVPVGPPSNDDCTTPIAVSGPGPHFFDNTQATTGAEGQTELLCNEYANMAMPTDVWFTWTPVSGGSATLTFCGLTITDTKVAVYDGTGCPTAPALACNDDSCGFTSYQSEVTFPAVCGQVYTIQIGTYPNYFAPAGGQGRFTVSVSGSSGCSVGTVFCAGDGIAPHLACPCGNNSSVVEQVGCLNSFGVAGSLRASGTPSLAHDTVVLAASSLPASSVLFYQGTTQMSGGAGSTFGDGLRCAGGTVVRLKSFTASGPTGSAGSTYPQAGNPAVSVRGMVTMPGSRTYQCWYRNAAPFCTPSTFNLSNGLQIDWQP